MMSTMPVASPPQAPDDPWLAGLYREHYRSLVRLASLLVDDRETSEEVVQDAFVKVYLARGRLRDTDRALPYLRSAVLNGARSQLRRRRVRRAQPAPQLRVVGSAEDTAVAGEETRRVMRALRSLPVRQRECLALRYYLDLSEAEIAETLGISAGSVKQHAHRGVEALGRTLEEER
jgi:RNA polymerase sigma-70 factor (sigma-E family)